MSNPSEFAQSETIERRKATSDRRDEIKELKAVVRNTETERRLEQRRKVEDDQWQKRMTSTIEDYNP